MEQERWARLLTGLLVGFVLQDAGSVTVTAGQETSPSTDEESNMWIALVFALTLGGAPTMKDLTLLTRGGCVNTPDMVNNLDDALTALKLPKDYQFIDIGKLSKDDPRTGYPTPTILWKGKDIFGMPAPKPPYDVPS